MTETKHVVFFDGHCNLCNASINFIIDRDKNKKFYFSALQSEFGQKFLAKHGLGKIHSSFIYEEDGKVYTESTAAIRISKILNFPWPMAYVLIVIPRFLRDGLYAFISKNRYRFFGKKDSCRMSEPGLESRFLVR